MARQPVVVALLFVSAVLFLAVADAQPNALKKPKIVKPANEKCKVKAFKFCYNKPIPCPDNCPFNCYINCVSCSPVCNCNVPGAACKDPRFIGADGITFYFHGKKDRDFCLLSDKNLHINAHFIGRRDPTMSRDFTWIQAVSLLFYKHGLYLGAKKTAVWDEVVDRLMIFFNGETVNLPNEEGEKWQSETEPTVTIVRTKGANSVLVEVDGLAKITANVVPITEEESRVHRYGITDEDCFAHLELGFKFYSLSNDVHGVLGQTYRKDYVSRVKMSSKMPIMSGEQKYASSNLYSTDCSVARFGQGGSGIAMASEYSNLKCESRMSGRGIVCKR